MLGCAQLGDEWFMRLVLRSHVVGMVVVVASVLMGCNGVEQDAVDVNLDGTPVSTVGALSACPGCTGPSDGCCQSINSGGVFWCYYLPNSCLVDSDCPNSTYRCNVKGRCVPDYLINCEEDMP